MQRIITQRERLILSVTASLIVFSIIFNFIIMPILSENSNLNREIKITKAKLKRYAQLLSNKEQIYSQYNKISAQLNLPNKQGSLAVDILSEIEELAKSSNISIVDVRPQLPQNSASPKILSVDLKTEGTMEAYLKFLYNLENSLSLLKIKRLQLSVKSAGLMLEGSLSITQTAVLE